MTKFASFHVILLIFSLHMYVNITLQRKIIYTSNFFKIIETIEENIDIQCDKNIISHKW
ncbi:MAG: hypothetical protein SP4CHLAM5_03150 [Chlamydiia bacterium]|nr:hypothetical protein [Chlamydiia bacterium]MCH9618189.1 hypothetical protein [Chlamydiia bacterium]MCH9624088.1 hypothetical protein [Chlamydiia bacterium]